MYSNNKKVTDPFVLFQALIAAVNETPEEDIRDALKSQTENQLALVPRGPKLVKDTIAYNTTITTDDTVSAFSNIIFMFIKEEIVDTC